MNALIQDFRYGVRVLLKNPGFTLVAVISLALGIGANTAIFQLLNAVRLKTLPVRAPQELAQIHIQDMDGARGSFRSYYDAVTNPVWEQIRDRQESFSGIAAWGTTSFNLAQGGEMRLANGLWVNGDFFNVLGIPPTKGRVFTAADDMRGCGNPGVVISNSFWQREYGGNADVIGRKITIATQSLEIIGVAPANFYGLEVGKTFDLALPSVRGSDLGQEQSARFRNHLVVDDDRAFEAGCLARSGYRQPANSVAEHLRVNRGGELSADQCRKISKL